MFHSTWATERE